MKRKDLIAQANGLLIDVTDAMSDADIQTAIDSAEAEDDTQKAAPKAKKKTKTMEVEIVRGYTPLDASLLEDGENKLPPGRVVALPEKEAKTLIRNGIAKFPDDDDLGDE